VCPAVAAGQFGSCGDNGGMAHRVSSRRLVGRGCELDLLFELVRRAGAGHGGAVVVAGEAGIGKSRLVSEFAQRAGEQGTRVLVGECVDLAEAELPYAPFVGALRAVVRDRNEPELAKLFGGARSELARLLPELGDSGPSVPGPVGQTRLFELVLGVLSRLGDERPVALVIEDVHWADGASLDLLAFLVRNQRSERLAMVLTFRSDELPPAHPVRARLAELQRGGRARRIDLEPLSPEEVAEQVGEITGTSPAAEFSHALHVRGQGNPFFTEELLAAGDEGRLPASLRDALLVRLRRLSDRAREIVDVAAVAGRSVDHRLLRTLVQMPDGELISALREAVAHQVLVSDGLSYAFRHALLREAVYADLVAGQRTPLHAALAEKLTEQPGFGEAGAGAAAEIAHHWYAAGQVAAALAASVRAGAEAERMYAILQARRQYERVLELWDRVAEPERITGLPRSAVLARAADAHWLAGDEAQAATLARAALEQPDLQRDGAGAAVVEERLANYLWGAGDSDGALQAAQRAVVRLDGAASVDRARALCAEGRMLVMRSRNLDALARLEESLSIARRTGASSEEAQALNYLGGALAFLGDYSGAIERLRAAVRIARQSGSWARGLSQYENLSEVLSEAGQLEQAHGVAVDGIAAARELGLQRSYGLVLMGRAALCALGSGRTSEAGELTAAALELGEQTFFAFNVLEARGRYELARGDFDAADRHLTAAQAMAERLGDPMWLGPVAAVRAELELWRGQAHTAAEIVRKTLALAPERQCLQHTSELHAVGARALAGVATAARALQRPTAASAEIAALHTRLGERLATAFPLGTAPPRVAADVALCRAEVSRAAGDSDRETWTTAVDAADHAGYAGRAVYARWRFAEALLETAARDDAETVLRQAAAAAATLGHRPLAGEIEALSRRARIRPATLDRSPSAPAPFGLTPRETEVLRLLADGLTNKQIAATLYISDKTAEHHVSRILGKLGVNTRSAAGSLAHRLAIGPTGMTPK
jgi:DNA-binding CsgD family transcriptional regulator/tetratricopeptide (TPR) repeat protein